MAIPVIRNGRYIDKRNGEEHTLLKFNSKTLVFQGGFEINIEVFDKFFMMVCANEG